MGLSIVGGRGHTSHPFGIDEPGIFISKVSQYVKGHYDTDLLLLTLLFHLNKYSNGDGLAVSCNAGTIHACF